MRNIRVSAIQIEVDKKTLEIYDSYITATSERARQASQVELEKIMAPIFGAKRISGNPRLIPDFFVEPKDLVPERGAYSLFQQEASGRLNIEAKFQRKEVGSSTATTIGSSSFASVLREIQANRKTIDSTEGLFKYLNSRLSSSGSVFDWLAKNAPEFHEQAYNKAKNLSIFTKIGGSILAYQVAFPRSKFRSGIFGANYYANKTGNSFTFLYYLNNSFEKSLLSSVQKSIAVMAQERLKDFVYDSPKKPVKITYGRGSSESIDIYTAKSNSIPTARLTTKLPEIKADEQPRIIDITSYVRGRTRLRMRRGSGNPYPPKIYERTGTFRTGDSSSSERGIQAIANYNTDIIEYFYEPHYRGLQRYGYEIDELVEGSIRAIARERLGQQFILKRSDSPIVK
jgi:hypothetical protein